jgi:hypothetical protein
MLSVQRVAPSVGAPKSRMLYILFYLKYRFNNRLYNRRHFCKAEIVGVNAVNRAKLAVRVSEEGLPLRCPKIQSYNNQRQGGVK